VKALTTRETQYLRNATNNSSYMYGKGTITFFIAKQMNKQDTKIRNNFIQKKIDLNMQSMCGYHLF
jgi:hypothetical protein